MVCSEITSTSLIMKKVYPVILGFLLLISCKPGYERPNVVLIMGDDIGYSDIGCYGSEIKTPTLDLLAHNGIQFRNFYNMAKCETSRATLLTGLYFGHSNPVHMASRLKEAGYTILQSGKEHFSGWVPEDLQAKYIFDQSFTFWASTNYFIPPDSSFRNPFFLNGREIPVKELAAEFPDFYKTDAVTDFALRFLDSAIREDKPFFLYLPYHAAHYPLQAKPEDIQKYAGVYDVGWDEIRAARYQRMLDSGVIDDRFVLTPPSDNINRFRGHPAGDSAIRAKIPLYRPWETLSDGEKKELSLEMTVFAAIVDRMDQNIARVVNYLKANGKYDNTLIMYLTDNGSCPYDSNRDFSVPPGPAEGFRTLSAAWANVGNTPFRYFKQFGHEGGSHTQFIAHWPDGIKAGQFTEQQGHIVDIFPTLLEICGASYPESQHGKPVPGLDGESLLPVFKGLERQEPEYFISGFQERFRMFRKGNWKIVRSNNDPWELYDISKDPSEVNNLADTLPDLTKQLVEEYIIVNPKLG